MFVFTVDIGISLSTEMINVHLNVLKYRALISLVFGLLKSREIYQKVMNLLHEGNKQGSNRR